jgi:hypothetical protein
MTSVHRVQQLVSKPSCTGRDRASFSSSQRLWYTNAETQIATVSTAETRIWGT